MECKNCSFELTEEDNFCKECGAKVIHNRLTFRNLWAYFSEQFLNYDNKLLQTYVHLFKKPEKVAGGFVDGIRKRYVNPFSYFALGLTLVGIQFFVMRKYFPEATDLSSLVPKNTPQSEMDISWSFDYYSLLALINIPFYALIARIVFMKLKRFNYTEHLVIMTYLSAQYAITNFPILLTTTIFGLNYYIAGNVMNLFFMIYVAYCYKRLYPLSTEGIILRSLFFIGILVLLLILSAVIQLIYFYFSGELQEMIDTNRAAQDVGYIVSSAMNWTS